MCDIIPHGMQAELLIYLNEGRLESPMEGSRAMMVILGLANWKKEGQRKTMTNDAELGGNMAWRNICVINDYTCNKRLWTEMITNATSHGGYLYRK